MWDIAPVSMYHVGSGGLIDIMCIATTIYVGAYAMESSFCEATIAWWCCGQGPRTPACYYLVRTGPRAHPCVGYGQGGKPIEETNPKDYIPNGAVNSKVSSHVATIVYFHDFHHYCLDLYRNHNLHRCLIFGQFSNFQIASPCNACDPSWTWEQRNPLIARMWPWKILTM